MAAKKDKWREGVLAQKKVIAAAFRNAMTEQGISQREMARRLSTSRGQVACILDAYSVGISLRTMVRMAGALGLRLEVSFEEQKKG